MAFADQLRVAYDHGTYPIPLDSNGVIPDIVTADLGLNLKGVRISYVYRFGDTTLAQSQALAQSQVLADGLGATLAQSQALAHSDGLGAQESTPHDDDGAKPSATGRALRTRKLARGTEGNPVVVDNDGNVNKSKKKLKVGSAGDAEVLVKQVAMMPPGYSTTDARKHRVVQNLQLQTGTDIVTVELVDLESVTNEPSKTVLREGTTFTVQSKDRGPVQVCVLLPCTVRLQDERARAQLFMVCVARYLDDNGNVLSDEQQPDSRTFETTGWGPFMLCAATRLHSDKCIGCPRLTVQKATYAAALKGLTLSAFQGGAMQFRLNASGFTIRECHLVSQFWQTIVPFDGKVTSNVGQFGLSNMRTGASVETFTTHPAPVARSSSGGGAQQQWPAPPNFALQTAQGGTWAQTQAATMHYQPATANQGPHLSQLQHNPQPNLATDMASVVNATASALLQQTRAPSQQEELNKTFMQAQANQMAKLQKQQAKQMAKLQKGLLQSLQTALLHGAAPTAASAAPAPAPQAQPETDLGKWLKANNVAFSQVVLTKLEELGVQTGEQLLCLEPQDWVDCGFLKMPLVWLAKLKMKAEES